VSESECGDAYGDYYVDGDDDAGEEDGDGDIDDDEDGYCDEEVRVEDGLGGVPGGIRL
jgi:hypothetical protein